MGQLGRIVDMERCIGCKTCVAACRNYYDLIEPESMPNEIAYYIRAETKENGKFPNVKRDYWVVMCQACKNPKCVKVCPSGALQKDPETGIVRLDRNVCVGCKSCVDACPYDVIMFDVEAHKAHKCQWCYERIVGGSQPLCVVSCLTDAQTIGDLEALREQVLQAGRTIDRSLSKESVLYVR